MCLSFSRISSSTIAITATAEIHRQLDDVPNETRESQTVPFNTGLHMRTWTTADVPHDDSITVIAAADDENVCDDDVTTGGLDLPDANDATVVKSQSEPIEDYPAPTNNDTDPSTVSNESSSPAKFDIGLYVGRTVDDYTKYRLLTKRWQPSRMDKMPYSEHMKQGHLRRRYLNVSHVESRTWLAFSPSQQGLYCKYCVLFHESRVAGLHQHVKLGQLVTPS